jgi:hypothetical protein
VEEDLGDAHVGDVFGADDAGLAGLLHLAAAEAEEGGKGQRGFEDVDELGAVVIAGGFAGGEEEARVEGCFERCDGGIPPPPTKVSKV